MFTINRKTKIKYRKLFEEYLLKKYSAKVSLYKHPKISYRRTQLKML